MNMHIHPRPSHDNGSIQKVLAKVVVEGPTKYQICDKFLDDRTFGGSETSSEYGLA